MALDYGAGGAASSAASGLDVGGSLALDRGASPRGTASSVAASLGDGGSLDLDHDLYGWIPGGTFEMDVSDGEWQVVRSVS